LFYLLRSFLGYLVELQATPDPKKQLWS
jgi:hypothetical protein